ncbi:MAG: ECF transporter S component [Oscillospiraceae bacterium]|nr:ECF transporter S component [Oscillospiraceae bacterium]
MKHNKEKTVRLTQLGLLSAVILIMSFTPLGYLRIAALEITFITVPVAVGAIVLGPVSGAVLGAVFGLTSFATCFGTSAFGATLLSINALATFAVCVIPRVLAGLLCGYAFHAFTKAKPVSPVTLFACALSCPLLNTLFFMGGLVLCFYNTPYIQSFAQALGATNPFTFILLFVGVQGLVEAVVCCLLAGFISKALIRYRTK